MILLATKNYKWLILTKTQSNCIKIVEPKDQMNGESSKGVGILKKMLKFNLNSKFKNKVSNRYKL